MNSFIKLSIVLGSALLAGCGGSGAGTVRGTVLAPNGDIPIGQARIDALTSSTDPTVIATTTSGADGTFTLEGAPVGPVTLKISKGRWEKTLTAEVKDDAVVELSKEQSTFNASGAGAPRIAVVLGAFDRMEEVLAKFGLGQITDGMLDPASAQFTLIDDGTGMTTTEFFASAAELAKYDVIFINCGADESPLSDAASRANIRQFVDGGGWLYATDLAYDYVEQVFPEAAGFRPTAALTSTPETLDAAELGTADITVDATVVDQELNNWAAARNLLNAQSKLPLTGFSSGWAVIEQVSDGATKLVEGPVTYDGGAGTKPLTFVAPSGQGKLIYSSYHTVHDDLDVTLKPQEQLLGYLLFLN